MTRNLPDIVKPWCLALVLSLFLVSCTKDRTPNEDALPPADIPDCTCDPLPFPEAWEWQLVGSGFSALNVTFNPGDGDEICYLAPNESGDQLALWLHQLSTGNKSILFEGEISSAPRWGADGRILLVLSDGNVYTLNTQDLSIQQITTSNDYRRANWNGDQSLIVVNRWSDNLTELISNEGASQGILESIYLSPTTIPWEENRMVSLHIGYITVKDLDKGDQLRVFDLTENASLYDLCTEQMDRYTGSHMNGPEFIYSYAQGVFGYNLINGRERLILSACDSRMYSSPAIHRETGKMIWARTSKTPIDSVTLEVVIEWVIMDLDGGNMTVLDL